MAHDLLPTDKLRATRLPAVGPFGALQAQMTRMLDDLWSEQAGLAPGGGLVPHPRVDVTEDEKNVYVTAEMPGLAENDIEVTFHDDHLHIAGEKVKEAGDGRRDIVTERAYGRFERAVLVGRNVDRDQIEARFDNGVLTVTVPKTEEEADRRRIEVTRG